MCNIVVVISRFLWIGYHRLAFASLYNPTPPLSVSPSSYISVYNPTCLSVCLSATLQGLHWYVALICWTMFVGLKTCLKCTKTQCLSVFILMSNKYLRFNNSVWCLREHGNLLLLVKITLLFKCSLVNLTWNCELQWCRNVCLYN